MLVELYGWKTAHLNWRRDEGWISFTQNRISKRNHAIVHELMILMHSRKASTFTWNLSHKSLASMEAHNQNRFMLEQVRINEVIYICPDTWNLGSVEIRPRYWANLVLQHMKTYRWRSCIQRGIMTLWNNKRVPRKSVNILPLKWEIPDEQIPILAYKRMRPEKYEEFREMIPYPWHRGYVSKMQTHSSSSYNCSQTQCYSNR